MAELATIARPYAEALHKALQATPGSDPVAAGADLQALAQIAADPALRELADDPRVRDEQVLDVLAGALGRRPVEPVKNLLGAVVENGRLSALGAIAEQYRSLADADSGRARAVVHSAFALDDATLRTVLDAVEQRFGRRLDATVVVEPELIGGVRVVVGDEVLDTSVRARLERMRQAIVA